jgi:crossover junction endodeoxyribonuclease RuvC
VRVVGLDLSLTGTGVTMYDTSAGTPPQCRTFGTKPSGDDVASRSRRLRGLVTTCWPYTQGADLVVIESPAYSSNSGHAHDRSGYWWMVVGRLTGAGVPVVEVRANTLKTYATGKGNAGKDEVLAAVVRRHLDVAIADNNQADSLVLALMGARSLGVPYDDPLPATHLRAMAAPSWPNR